MEHVLRYVFIFGYTSAVCQKDSTSVIPKSAKLDVQLRPLQLEALLLGRDTATALVISHT